MKVFIENEAGSTKKNLFNEKTLEHRKTVVVSRPYPFPYGFIIGTTSGDGDNLDCFVLTQKPLKSGDIVDVEAIGMFEQTEDGKSDPKILARLHDENPSITVEIEKRLRDFIQHVFDHLPDKSVSIGRFLASKEAQALIQRCFDKPKSSL
jgi:inorganic pyrophosphatase